LNDIVLNEWQNEPDYLQGIFYNLPCFIRRHDRFLTLNGYVGLPEGHRYYNIAYELINEVIEIHGGVTFTNMGTHAVFGKKWWVGFDCGHPFDLIPGLYSAVCNKHLDIATKDMLGKHYRNINYVQNECIKLALQLQENPGLKFENTEFHEVENYKELTYDK